MGGVYKGRVKWTPEMDAKLVGLFEYGLRSSAVAEQMEVSISAAEARYRRLRAQKEQTNG